MRKLGYSISSLFLLLCLLASAAHAEPAWVKTGKGALNMRSKASSKSEIVGRVPNGSKVDVLAEAGDWCKIEYKGKSGYVQSGFLADEPAVTPTPAAPEATPAAVIQAGGFARIATGSGALNMRSKTDAKSTVITRVPDGKRVEVEEATAEWTRIVYGGKSGYVQTTYLVLDSQLIGQPLYSDDDYLYVRPKKSESARSLTTVHMAQPMTLLAIEEDWVQVACQDEKKGAIVGYVSMDDISLWRSTPKRALSKPATVAYELSASALRLGEELDVTLSLEENTACTVRIRKDGKTVLAEKEPLVSAFSYRPREAGVYQMELIAHNAESSIGYEVLFTVEPNDAKLPVPDVYSQKDGWWLDKRYGRSNLDQSGCAIFALSHALKLLGKDSEQTTPDVLAKTYPMYLAASGTVTSNLLAAAGRDFGFKTAKDKVFSPSQITNQFKDGAVFSFAIVSGHIALATGLSKDGSKVRIADSAPSATFERIKDAQLYIPVGMNSYEAVASLAEIPGAKYYIETDQYGGLEYYLDLSYVAQRGVRPIQP